jgi:methyl-accepting chemotaxis protein
MTEPAPPAATPIKEVQEPVAWVKALQNIVELVGHTQTRTSSMAAAFGTLSTNLTAVLAKVGQLDNIMESIADLKDNQTTMLEEMVDRTGPSLLTRVLLLEADIRELKHQIRELKHQIRELKRDRDRP